MQRSFSAAERQSVNLYVQQGRKLRRALTVAALFMIPAAIAGATWLLLAGQVAR